MPATAPSSSPTDQQRQQQQYYHQQLAQLSTSPDSSPLPPYSITTSSNPFSQGGSSCADHLDDDHGFSNLCVPEETAERSGKFRVDITNFTQKGRHRQQHYSTPNDTNNITTNGDHGGSSDDDASITSSEPKRVINQASALATTSKDGSLATARPNRNLRADARWLRSGNGRRSSSNSSGSSGSNSDTARISIITIPQEFSNGPLQITKKALQDLISQLDLPTTFLPVLYAFGSVPRMSEAGLDCCTIIKDPIDKGSFTLCDLDRFRDRDPGKTGRSREWKDRQIGVLHRHCASTNEDLFVFLQPHPNSFFDGGVEYDIQDSPEAMSTLFDNPFCLHQMLISSYFSGWREYLRDVADDFARCSAEAFSQDITNDYSIDFNFLQRWRNTVDSVAPIGATLDSIDRIVRNLEDVQRECVKLGAMLPVLDLDIFLQTTLSQTKGLRQSAQTLEKRVANIAELLTNTIDGKNQLDAATLNRHMERLTLDTADDNTSVKIITALSLIYLPGSFVATLFGMNLFGFNDQTRRITIAKNFWLYVVIFIPLTLLTGGLAWQLSEKAKKKREERERMIGAVHLH